MRRVRLWSVKHSKGLKRVYALVETVLIKLSPIIKRLGYQRLDGPVHGVEKLAKGFLLDSQSCGECIVGDTGMSCPMNCPKSLRNGPCGGVRANGKCEVDADMNCVWVLAWQGNKNMQRADYPIQKVQMPLDHRLKNSSAWLRKLRQHRGDADIIPIHKA